ncbi:hypothetical protein AX16_005193 [Volvariella volvacea WC 439]|nr:hypothetical protein AX16_005193 [Volvariella volvacea WC 439]
MPSSPPVTPLSLHPHPLNIIYDSDDDMHVDSDNDRSKDADADGDFVEDDTSPVLEQPEMTHRPLPLSHHTPDSDADDSVGAVSCK